MTLQLRPTFSESWYRVKTLRAKLRSGAQISRQFYRGERWYVVRDPAGNQFHRLSDPAYRFVGLLDGSRTVEEAWDLAGGQLADDAPTQPEVIQILSHLYSANLIDADVTPDATVLLRRHKQLNKKKLQGRLMNLMFPRIPLWDPDAFLVRWMPLVRQLFSKFGAIVWLIVVGAACVAVAPMWPELKVAAANAIDVRSNTLNLVLLWGMFVFIKLIHELGHAFGTRRFGGECHELGIMFLIFIPTPYVDASSAWSFPNKWQRIFVGAGGMIVELFFAALAAFVWKYTYGSGSVVNQLAFNAMLVASVTTIIFNANPLLRYDGYYILSDYLEIPNLRQKSTEYTLGLVKRHVFGVKAHQPLPPGLQRFWLFTYCVTSSIYRTFVGIMIILLVAFEIPILGALMAAGGVVTWLFVPVFKIFKYLSIEPELHRKRGRATAFTLVAAACAIVLVGIIKFPLNLDAIGITEPTVRAMVRAETAGLVEEVVMVKVDGQMKTLDGEFVAGPVYETDAAGKPVMVEDFDRTLKPKVKIPGQKILVLRSDELEAEILSTEAKLRGAEAKYDLAVSSGSSGEAGIHQDTIKLLRAVLDRAQERKDKLVVRAPQSGILIAPQLAFIKGSYLKSTDAIGRVDQNDQLTVHVLGEQKDFELIIDQRNRMGHIDSKIRLAGDLGTVLKGGPIQDFSAATDQIRHPMLSAQGGESEVQLDPRHEGKTASEQFDIGVPLANPGMHYVSGQRAHVRFVLDHKPLIWQWGRRFFQLIQTQSQTKSKLI